MTGDELKAIRTTSHLTQKELAASIGVTSNTVTRWEMGLHPIPEMAVKLIMYTATNCKLEQRKKKSSKKVSQG